MMKRLFSMGFGCLFGAIALNAPLVADAAPATQGVTFRVVIPKLEPLRLDVSQEAQRLAVGAAGGLQPGTREFVDAHGRRHLRQTISRGDHVDLILVAP